MTSFVDISALLTAFFVGLLGSGHCFGMCAGIAAGLGSLPVHNDTEARAKPQALSAFLFNLGRILSYACLGLVSAWLLSRVGKVLNVPQWSMILRFLTALMIFLIGLQYLLNWNTLAFIEKAGAKVWKHVLPLAVRASSSPGGTGRLMLGLLWGLLRMAGTWEVSSPTARGISPSTHRGQIVRAVQSIHKSQKLNCPQTHLCSCRCSMPAASSVTARLSRRESCGSTRFRGLLRWWLWATRLRVSCSAGSRCTRAMRTSCPAKGSL